MMSSRKIEPGPDKGCQTQLEAVRLRHAYVDQDLCVTLAEISRQVDRLFSKSLSRGGTQGSQHV